MAAQFLGLKLRLLGGAFRRSPWQVAGVILGLVYGVLLTVILVSALVAARFAADTALVRDIVVLAGSATVLGFLVVPLFRGVDDTLDPRAFALFGMPNRRVAAGLAVAALLSVPAIVLALCALATIVTWSQSAASTIVAIVAAAAAIATCTLASRVTTSFAAFFLASRRARDVAGLIGVLVLLMLAPLVVLLVGVNWIRDGMAVLRTLADAASWTPLGAVWAAPAEAARGEFGPALLKLLIALAFAALLWAAWEALVSRMLVTPGRATQSKAYSGLGWFGRVPGNPAGVVAARSLTYWGRDARYWMSLVLIPVVPAVMIAALLVVGVVPVRYVALCALPVMCLFLGWGLHNDVSYDGTAVWVHVSSGIRGWADRIGRLVPILVIGVPLIAVGTILTSWAYGDGRVIPAIIGVSTCTLLAGIGLSSLTSALFPYPAPKPGDSPFQQPQSTGALAATVQSLSFLVILIFAAPSAVLLVVGVMGNPQLLPIALYAGVGIGLAVAIVGVWAGGVVFDRRGPEMLAAALRSA